PNTLRGPVRFDEFGNVVGNIYIRKVEKKDGRYVNAGIKTYPDVSQFWTYKQDEFLKNPVYSRDYPPAKNLEPWRSHPSAQPPSPPGLTRGSIFVEEGSIAGSNLTVTALAALA